MIQIRQPQHSATVIRLDFLLAHGDGLPCRRIELRQTVWAMQVLALATGLELVLSAIACLQQLR